MSMLGPVAGIALWFAATPKAEGAAISWSVAPGVSCPTARELETAYRREGRSSPVSPRASLVVSVLIARPSVETLDLKLSTTPAVFEAHREIVAGPDHCEALAQTIVILVDAWLRDLPELARASEPPLDSATVIAPAQGAVVPHFEQPAITAEITVGERKSTELGFALYAGADAFVSSTTAAALTFGADLRVSQRFSVEATASLIQNLTVADSIYGSIDVQRQLFGVVAALTVWRSSSLSLGALGGLVLWHGAAQSFGYPAPASRDLLDPGLVLGARAQQSLGGAFYLQGQAAVVALYRAYDLEVGRPSGEVVTLTTLQRLTLDLSIGVGVQIF